MQHLSAVECGDPGARADDSSVIIALQASCELLGLISRCSHLNTMREAKMQQGMGRGINFTFYIRNYPGLSIHTDIGVIIVLQESRVVSLAWARHLLRCPRDSGSPDVMMSRDNIR